MLNYPPIVNVNGGTSNQIKCITDISLYCINVLMPRMNYLDISIYLKNLSHGLVGECRVIDDPAFSRPRTFDIEIHGSMKLSEQLRTVVHEIVHVKQYARGELYQSARSSKIKWKGEWYTQTNVKYCRLPWEVEAFDKEKDLYQSWTNKKTLSCNNGFSTV